MPAKANVISQANRFCSEIVSLNNTLGGSVAPGTSGAELFISFAGNDFNGFTYSQLYNLAKTLGTSSDCRRMY